MLKKIHSVFIILKLVVVAAKQEIIGNPTKKKIKADKNICFKCQSAENVEELACGHFYCAQCITEQGCEFCGMMMSVSDVSTIAKNLEKEVETGAQSNLFPKDCEEHYERFDYCLQCKQRRCTVCVNRYKQHDHYEVYSQAALQKGINDRSKSISNNYKQAIFKNRSEIIMIDDKIKKLVKEKKLIEKKLNAANRSILVHSELNRQLEAVSEEKPMLAIFDCMDSHLWGYESAPVCELEIKHFLISACRNGDIAVIRKLFKLLGNYPVSIPLSPAGQLA